MTCLGPGHLAIHEQATSKSQDVFLAGTAPWLRNSLVIDQQSPLQLGGGFKDLITPTWGDDPIRPHMANMLQIDQNYSIDF